MRAWLNPLHESPIRIRTDFDGASAGMSRSVSLRLGMGPESFLGERVQAAIVLLANGNFDRFIAALEAAQTDWRDTLDAADLATEDWRQKLDRRLGRGG
jgi:hypothetical protein